MSEFDLGVRVNNLIIIKIPSGYKPFGYSDVNSNRFQEGIHMYNRHGR